MRSMSVFHHQVVAQIDSRMPHIVQYSPTVSLLFLRLFQAIFYGAVYNVFAVSGPATSNISQSSLTTFWCWTLLFHPVLGRGAT